MTNRSKNSEVERRLIETGEQLFLAVGFHACGVQEIADAAGVPKGSFYSYFETKEAFAVAVLEAFWTGVEKRYGGILQDPALKPLERNAKYFKSLSESKARTTTPTAVSSATSPWSLLARVRKTAPSWRTSSSVGKRPSWLACVKRKPKGKRLSGQDLRELAASIIESWEGAVMRAKVEQRRAPHRRFEEVILPSLLR